MGTLKECRHCYRSLDVSHFDKCRNGWQFKNFCRSCCKELSEAARKIALAAARRIREDRNVFFDGNKKDQFGETYNGRNINCRLLGFRDYKDYLASDLWKRVRALVFKMKGRSCYLCGDPATQVHHNRYSKNDLLGKKIRFLNPICRTCHERIEFDGDAKCTVSEAQMAFKAARKMFNKRQQQLSMS